MQILYRSFYDKLGNGICRDEAFDAVSLSPRQGLYKSYRVFGKNPHCAVNLFSGNAVYFQFAHKLGNAVFRQPEYRRHRQFPFGVNHIRTDTTFPAVNHILLL